MTALQHIGGTGMICGGVAGVCLIGLLLFLFVTYRKRYLYTKRFRKINFPEQFYQELREQYKKTESITQTLDLLLERYPRGKVARRIRASRDYLKHSHYKDYETALYRYLADTDTANVITEVLLKDLQKIRRLPCKQEYDLRRIENEKK